MADFYRLRNQIKHYEWGSPDLIPRLEGITADGRPWAEMWMGVHPASPSAVSFPSGDMWLGDLIAGDPRRFLGEKTAERYGNLPFLFKLIAAEKPLSIQAHPNLAQAREGWERENRAGLAQDAPNRSYRDSNHKPEIICALTPFTGMCGFRSPKEIYRLLEAFLSLQPPVVVRNGFAPLMQTLTPGAESLRDFLSVLFGLPSEVRKALTEFIADGNAGPFPISGEWELMRDFSRQYPGDPAIIAPLYLNVFHLEPGEAIFLKAGILHAYIHGFAVELMTNSDNVLRGGLTVKHIDVPELMKVTDFNPCQPHVIKPEPGLSSYTYPAPCDEFSLTVLHGTGSLTAPAFARTPAICIVTGGEVFLESPGDVNGVIKQGESAFIPPGSGLVLQGRYTLYVASVPL
ncbi:MAG: mannose-6-phosphate isomerase, class I [Treponema sp.]|nr:mannose-6-phosphate isomerase, class I [Treponema sp.]